MRSLLLLNVLAMVAVATPITDTKLDKHWEMWKNKYEQTYAGEQDEMERRQIWEENYKKINLHNIEYSMGMRTFTMAMNAFGDLTHEEILQRTGFLSVRDTMALNDTKHKLYQPDPYEHLPKCVDWRKKGYVTDVKDQGACGSCWAFSAIGSLEGQYYKASGCLVAFSEQQLVDCSGDFGPQGCGGGWMDQAYEYIRLFGIETGSTYPYNATDNICQYNSGKVVTKVDGHIDILTGSEEHLQHAVATQGPIAVAIDFQYSFLFYSSGVYCEPECQSRPFDLSHAVLVVGYGSQDGHDYWSVKNSWGKDWGDNGYIKMLRNVHNQCGIATVASYPQIHRRSVDTEC